MKGYEKKMTMGEAIERMASDPDGDLILYRREGFTALQDNLTVGGSLDLRGTQIAALPDNLTVGGYLDLEGTQIAALPKGLVVGKTLDIRNTKISELPDDLVVGWSIETDNYTLATPPHTLNNGDYVAGRYLYADNMLTHIKRKRTVQGYTLYIGKIKGENVVSDGKNYSHCKTLRDGISDLAFKNAADRGADQYKGLTLDSVLTPEQIIQMYRIITGACKAGTQRFVDSLGELKKEYTVREVIEIVKGQYNAEKFAEFFGV